MNWKSLFSSKILSRGREYCRENTIKKYEETEDHITAEIAGTDLYTVNISLENGEISQMECTCPYAQDGKACKHMAAALYRHSGELDEPELFGYIDTVEVYEQRQEAIRCMVYDADEETVREYLSEILMEEEKYLLRFKAMTDADLNGFSLQQYAQQIDSLAEIYTGKHGYIGYYQADEFAAELGEILDTDVRLLMDREYYECQKKEIYQMLGDREHYKEQLWKLVTDFHLIDLEFYRELRGLYEPEVWEEKREAVFRSATDFQSLNRLLEEEQLYDRLLNSVLQSSGMYTLRIYKDVLAELYPQQILQKYRDELDLMAKRSGDRNHYRSLAESLEEMKEVKGGPEVVADILADWRVRYKRCPAMMEELSSL